MENKKLLVIGITGGVGCGKTTVLEAIKEKCNCKIILTDLLAKQLQQPGAPCYEELVTLLGKGVLNADGTINNGKMAEIIFRNRELLEQVNDLIHPKVIQNVLDQIEDAKREGVYDFFFVEAALLIESGFGTICDELWYIYAKEDIRRKRLMLYRGYSEEKTTAIMNKQLSDEAFRKHCKVIIDNSNSREETDRQINQILEAYLWHR